MNTAGAGGRKIAIVPQNGDAKRAGETRVVGHRTLNLGAKVVHREVPMLTDFIETAPRETVQLDARTATVDHDVSALKTTHFGTAGYSADLHRIVSDSFSQPSRQFDLASIRPPPKHTPGFSLRKKLNLFHIEQADRLLKLILHTS